MHINWKLNDRIGENPSLFCGSSGSGGGLPKNPHFNHFWCHE